ncbi:MAG: phosphopentomutase [Candidatus Aminicenantes bacterium]|nr:phosphopentomutase [Candidatus Aminicenantes bacterium]
MIKRVILIVLDSVGAGALPDAAEYGDTGANTLANTAKAVGGLHLPNLQALGLGNILPIQGVPPAAAPLASYGKMAEASKGKDTIAGHWEMMGIILDKAFPTFPSGFGADIISAFQKETGAAGILGNKPASGTVIIRELGEAHIKTGFPIVYTSTDSVFQVAAHEEVIPVPELYRICEQTRKICNPYRVGRVIARPFTGTKGNFTRTKNRRDFPMKPPRDTALDLLKKNGFPVAGIGKIEDIYAGRGLTRAVHTKDNTHGMQCLTEELSITKEGLIFINLVDFDMVYGHRNNPGGYAAALNDFDAYLGGLLPRVRSRDLLVITADHGCDPTHPGTDHTREYVPLLVYNPDISPQDLGTRKTFADIGVTILNTFAVEHSLPGENLFNTRAASRTAGLEIK